MGSGFRIDSRCTDFHRPFGDRRRTYRPLGGFGALLCTRSTTSALCGARRCAFSEGNRTTSGGGLRNLFVAGPALAGGLALRYRRSSSNRMVYICRVSNPSNADFQVVFDGTVGAADPAPAQSNAVYAPT